MVNPWMAIPKSYITRKYQTAQKNSNKLKTKRMPKYMLSESLAFTFNLIEGAIHPSALISYTTKHVQYNLYFILTICPALKEMLQK